MHSPTPRKPLVCLALNPSRPLRLRPRSRKRIPRERPGALYAHATLSSVHRTGQQRCGRLSLPVHPTLGYVLSGPGPNKLFIPLHAHVRGEPNHRFLSPSPHTHAHTCAHMHTQTAHMHACVHIQTYIHAYTHVQAHTGAHTHTGSETGPVPSREN